MLNKDNTNQMFKFNQPTTREAVARVLDDDDCRRDVSQALHGAAGSRAFNQFRATTEFLLHDQLNGAVITSKMEAGELNHRQVWIYMAAALKSIEKQVGRLMLEVAK